MRTVIPISPLGNLIAAAEERLLRVIAADQPAVADGIRRTLEAMHAELCAADAPCTERLLVDQILLSWLEVYSFQLGGEDLLRDDKLQRSYDRVMRRYQAAMLALARLQKLNLAAQRARAAVAGAASPSTAQQPQTTAQPAVPHTAQPVGGARRSAPLPTDTCTNPMQTLQCPPADVTTTPAPVTTPSNAVSPTSNRSHRRSRVKMKRHSAPLSPA